MRDLYWKKSLVKQATILRYRIRQKRWTDSTFANVEQAVMVGFYSIRKLIEARDLTDFIRTQRLKIVAYAWKGKRVTRLNRFFPNELYNLKTPHPLEKDLLFLCHQVVHSYLFELSFNRARNLNGVFISSDRERNRAVYFLRIRQIIKLFEQVGNDYPTQTKFTYNPKTQDYDVQVGK
jgi:hypothetical protein